MTPKIFRIFIVFALFLFLGGEALAQESGSAFNPSNLSLQLDLNGKDGLGDVGVGIQIVVLMTLLTLAPTLILLMTSFIRIVIVLGFVRQALGTQTTPSNQIIVGLSLFLTFFIMGPVWTNIYQDAVVPYTEETITSKEAFSISTGEIKAFMLRQTRIEDVEFFLALSKIGPTRVNDLPLTVVVPAFVLSELRTAFQMGVLIFIPFLVIDFVVASTLMSLGMMMMPPVMISLPFKLLLFVLVDGWYLILRSLVQSFSM